MHFNGMPPYTTVMGEFLWCNDHSSERSNALVHFLFCQTALVRPHCVAALLRNITFTQVIFIQFNSTIKKEIQ